MKRIELSFKRIDQSPSDLSTKFQGFLMENLEPDYVTWLHEQETNPYSLKIIHQKDKTLWSLHLLTDEAVKQILPVLLELKRVELHDLPTLMVESLSMQDLSSEQLFEFFNENQDRSLYTIHFQTPTGFRSQGEYVLFPTMRLIFQSLMMKFDKASTQMEVFGKDILETFEKHVEISMYKLRSTSFHLDGTKVPAFIGDVTIVVKGPVQLVNLANMLLTFGTYSGVGIKTGIGMGGIAFE